MTLVTATESRVPAVNYLEDLTLRLATGIGTLPEELQKIHVDYFQSAQREDGGFAGRDQASDLYYTSFALRGLAITGKLYGTIAQQAAQFLTEQIRQVQTGRQMALVDILSLFYSTKMLETFSGIHLLKACPESWLKQIVALLEGCRREDGGYAKSPESGRSSTYHTFLILLCLGLLEHPLEKPETIAAFLQSQQRSDGGFVEFAPMRRSGTNPTAAAIGGLRILGCLSENICERTSLFFAGMQTPEGGFRANTRIPVADLLSTFTGLLTLTDLGGEDRIKRADLAAYAQRMADASGGFHGAAWDEGKDVEYTFYGLGTLALLASH
jgi:geranylgeranyl transferase type-2 subunit beta